MGAWVAQSVGRLTSVQVMISQSVSSSPASGSVLTAQSLEPALGSVSPSLSALPPLSLSLFLSKINIKKMQIPGVPGWLSQLSVQLWLRSWSHGSWVQAPHRALCWQLRAWSLLRILCLSLSLPLPHSCSVSVLKVNKTFFKKKCVLFLTILVISSWTFWKLSIFLF